MVTLPPQVFVCPEKPVPDKINPIADDLFWKPRGGMWTSTLDDDGGDWVRWLHGEGYTLDMPRWGGDLWLLKPKPAKLYVLANPDNYNELAERFPHEMARTIGLKSFERMVCWPDVAKHYDGIHVPMPWSYRFLIEEEHYAAGLFFNICDAESTCWFKWCFEGESELLDLKALPV